MNRRRTGTSVRQGAAPSRWGRKAFRPSSTALCPALRWWRGFPRGTTMAAKLSSEAWAQIRHDYEDTERLVADICAEHGISSGTLRDRVRRWGWTRRRLPIPSEGPLRAPPQNGPGPCAAMRACDAAASLATAPQIESAAPYYPDVPQVAAGEVA